MASITSMSSVRTSVVITGQFNRTLTGVPNDLIGTLGATTSSNYTYGTSGADTINQAVTFIFTATNNTTTRLDLSGALTDVTGGTSGTFTTIKWILFELLSVAQDSVSGTACSSVTISPASSNPITTSPLGAAKTYVMESGDKWMIEKHTANGITVTAGSADGFDVLNNDATNSGAIRITALGNF